MTLSMPILWVILPLILAGLASLVPKKRLFGILLTSLTALGLSTLAIFFPEELSLTLGALTLDFIETLDILGRQISVSLEMLPFIALLFTATGVWIFSSGIKGMPSLFAPTSLAITALLTAALGIEPFLYAALLIQAVVLVSIPVLSSGMHNPHRGILRYISLQTIAMPFILFAGWLLSGIETLPPESGLIGQSAMVLGLGFALLLGIFPFHSWAPMVSEQAHPAVITFITFIAPTVILVFGLSFFNRYPFLRDLENLPLMLRIFGTLMTVVGGLWTAFQQNLKRAFGFSSLTETGFSLLALSLIPQGGFIWLLMFIPARALGFWLWGYTLGLIQTHTRSLDLQSLQGFARRYPILSVGLLLAQLSTAGLPILAAFPIKLTLFTALRGPNMGGPGLTFFTWSFIGNLGLFLFTLRLLSYLVSPEKEAGVRAWGLNEQLHEYLPVLAAILLLVLMGLMPGSFLSVITDTLTAFPQLQ
jgi:NADH-quinone oxidoreductase subunit N